MRGLLLCSLAALVAGCVLPEPTDLEFVESAFARDGELFDELDFGPAMEADGYSDCGITFDLDGRTDEPAAGCPSCDVEMVVDLTPDSDDCDLIPSGADNSILGLSIGFNGDRGYFHDGANWVQWLIGDSNDGSYEGSTGWGSIGGWQLRETLSVEWIEPPE